jgi:hypothetical protein
MPLRRFFLGCGKGTAELNLASHGIEQGGPRRERMGKYTFYDNKKIILASCNFIKEPNVGNVP